MVRPWLLVLAVGCEGTEDELAPSPAEIVDGTTVVGYEAIPGAGDAPYRAAVRAINAFGASVPSGEITVQLDGVDTVVSFDGLGYGGVVAERQGVSSLVVDGNVPVDVHVWRSPWPGFGGSPASPAPIPEVAEVFGVTGGIIGHLGPDLWFVGDGLPPHRVLHADADLLGVRATNVDVDGQVDLVAWTSKEVIVLRGHTGGGFGWGTAFRASGLSVASAAVGDLSGDNIPDIAIAWVDASGQGVLDVWEGAGVFRFEAAEPRSIPGLPGSLVVSDANADGVGQVTVLLEDGGWARFLRGAERQYIPVGPYLPEVLLIPRGSALEPCGDTNSDDADEIAVSAPFESAEAARAFWFIDINTDALECEAGVLDAQCRTTYILLDSLVGGDAVCADADGDHLDDLWAYDRNTGVRLFKYDLFYDDFRSSGVEYPFGAGVFGVSDRDGDGIADPIVATAGVWSQWLGAPAGESEGVWSVRREPTLAVRQEVVGPFLMLEADGNPDTQEFLTTQVNGTDTYLRVVTHEPGTEGSQTIGQIKIDDFGNVPTDLAVCGPAAYFAVGGKVVLVDLTDPHLPQVVGSNGTDVTRVDCGVGPGGATVATIDEGNLVMRNLALTALANTPGPFGDVALAALGGATEEPVTCDTDGCSITEWAVTDTEIEVIVGDAASIRVREAGGTERPIGGTGTVSVTDADGDGRSDLVGYDAANRRVTVFRATGAAMPPPKIVHLGVPFSRIAFWDGDLDGINDVFGLDDAGALVHTVLALPPEEPTLPTDSGDTGGSGS